MYDDVVLGQCRLELMDEVLMNPGPDNLLVKQVLQLHAYHLTA